MRRGYYCRDCKILSESCKKALDNLELMRKQILNFCYQNFSAQCQTSIVQFTDKRQSHQHQPIMAIDNKGQWEQSPFFVRNTKHQFEVDGVEQGQNQFLPQRQIDEIRQECQKDNDRNNQISRSQILHLQNELDQTYKELSQIRVNEEIRQANKKQKNCIKQIEKQLKQVQQQNYQNVSENEQNTQFNKQNQDVRRIFEDYSRGFEDEIKKKAAMENEIKQWSRLRKDLEADIEKLKYQNYELKKKEDQLQNQLKDNKIKLEQLGKDNQTIQMQFTNKEAIYQKDITEKQELIQNLLDQSEISQSENYTRQNEILIFFTSILVQIEDIQKNAPKL